MRLCRKNVLPVVIGGLLAAGVAGTTATALAQSQARTAVDRPATGEVQSRPWAVAGGDIGIRWNNDLAGDLGIRIRPASVLGTRASDGSERFALQPFSQLRFNVDNGYAREMTGGALQARGGYRLELRDGSIDLDGFRLVPRKVAAGAEPEFDLVGADGVAWFHVDHVMHELLDDPAALTIGSSDIMISERLARRIGAPYAAGWPIGEVQLDATVQVRGSGGARPLANYITWHGAPAPNGGVYENDLFMQNTTLYYTRCRSCTGPNGSGQVVFTPSSTLKNNVNEGNISATVPGDPLGTSTARWTATIPWYQKFTAPSPPYQNDQHPYLIWNMYRTNADGSIEQIGRSGVKQAYLTTNGSCLDSGDHHGHALGRGCTDTYSAGNNDYTQGLSPRSELVPSAGLWGRCGSTFDTNCDGVMNTGPGDEYWERLVVRESQIAPSLHPGATWMYESWYIARDDINIYNSMSSRPVTPAWTGSTWNASNGSERLGPAIDRWFAQGNTPTNPRNPKLGARFERTLMTELVTEASRAKVAVKAKRLPSGLWQYHYAVMNFEFAFADITGTNPNIRVANGQGFDAFALATSAGAQVSGTVFRDGDINAGNDWQFSTGGSGIEWRDAAGGNSLSWGVLYSFTLMSTKPPVDGVATLRADGTTRPRSFQVATLVPGA
ncbi:hypothetical protein [Luteimonas sp. MC1828]|uniref:hypothetical protein n=1 Tax=Luteimonas sp. MC1828 TaxID=2799787 RepID=UPI0018F26E0A|nr:hypothetical protein [Luteimonas sp. MC1828]MBJ7575114.1 hypothetical protein [Luteimonas sp. MC1828]